jgi:hypothetical protein
VTSHLINYKKNNDEYQQASAYWHYRCNNFSKSLEYFPIFRYLSVPGPDYVFNDDYKLFSLAEIKTYIDKNKHLPEVLSAKEMEANGVNLGEMNMLLLKKIEELTLFVIELKKNDEILRKEIETVKKVKVYPKKRQPNKE